MLAARFMQILLVNWGYTASFYFFFFAVILLTFVGPASFLLAFVGKLRGKIFFKGNNFFLSEFLLFGKGQPLISFTFIRGFKKCDVA